MNILCVAYSFLRCVDVESNHQMTKVPYRWSVRRGARAVSSIPQNRIRVGIATRTEAKVSMKPASQKILTAFSLMMALATVLACAVQYPGIPFSSMALKASRAVAGGWEYPLSARGAATATLNTGTFAPPMAPPLGLVMADFTGDTHPDLATVEVDRFDSSTAHYWIEIRLTEGGHQLLRLSAPFGGLLVTPRDVTGDGNLDLVIRSVKSRAPVALFLNDGSGHFSRADVAPFANALRDGPSQVVFTTHWTYITGSLA
jgi:hypothetical protein